MRKRLHLCPNQPSRRHSADAGIGRGAIFLGVILVIIIILIGWKVLQNQGPSLLLHNQPRGLGQSTQLAIEARDRKHNVRRITLDVSQNGHALYHTESLAPAGPVRWWKAWSKAESVVDWTAPLNRRLISGLSEGSATIQIAAINDSWGRFFRGGESRISLTLPVRFTPPQIGVITTQHYINQGGCDMVVFHVSPGTVESGVQVGKYFFRSFPVKPSLEETRLAIFAYPWDLDPSTPAEIVARDDAGNQAVANFSYRVFPKKFHTDTIALDDAYIARVVPPIMSETPDLDDQGSPLKNFLAVNGHLRQVDSDKLIELAKQTAPAFLWHEPFNRLASKTEAYFADARTYTYNGQVVDHQTHLGFDLAGLEHMPVLAANDGVVVMAQFFGIFGNAVLIDHGMGVQTLYGHMSQLEVKPGEAV